MTQAVSIAQGGSNNVTMRNRIINGGMMIAQYPSTSTSVSLSQPYWVIDRTVGYGTTSAGVYTLAQSSTAATNFQYSLSATVTTADSSLSGSAEYGFRQNIEGLNVYDLEWGTANAKAITISFWVRSSLTGTFAGSVCNSGYDRSYVFSYTINSANTFEYKTVTIAGDTSGTWLKTNGVGMRLQFNLGAAANRTTSAGAWTAGYYQNATGSVQTISTNSATFYITGIQLEKGSTATPFENRMYGTELALCQRYYQKLNAPRLRGVANTTTTLNRMGMPLLVTMRVAPTATSSGTHDWYDGVNTGGASTVVAAYATPDSIEYDFNASSGTTGANRPIVFYVGASGGFAIASAEL